MVVIVLRIGFEQHDRYVDCAPIIAQRGPFLLRHIELLVADNKET